MNLMKKITFLVISVLLLVSCSNKVKIDVVDSLIDFRISELKGTQVQITFSPQNDMCRYLFGVLSVEEFDRQRESIGEQGIMEDYLLQIENEYEAVCDAYRELGASYIADFEDMAVYFGETTMYFIGLQPSTEYYVLAFCVDPFKREPCGLLHRQLFTTTELLPSMSDMMMTFLVQDNGERLYFYTKPTTPDGKISREPYLVDIVPDAVLYGKPYSGDIVKYAYDWYAEKSKDIELLRYYMHSDISREEAYIVDRSEEDAGYTIFGAPYNLNNISSLFCYHFTFRKGMYSGTYKNDQAK